LHFFSRANSPDFDEQLAQVLVTLCNDALDRVHVVLMGVIHRSQNQWLRNLLE
jgi:hypothetical protein